MTKHEEALLHYKGGVRNRRVRAQLRLKEQLVRGTKPLESSRLQKEPVFQDLTDKDKERINKEILIIQSKT